MKKQERKDLDKYINGKEVQFLSKETERIFFEISSNIYEFERPDFYAVYKNTIYLIEHFEFDCSDKNVFGGSSLHKLTKDIEKEAAERIAMGLNEFSKTIDCPASAKNYLPNLISVFEKHYRNIEEYKERIKSKLGNNFNLKVVFVIIDRNNFGSHVLSNGCVRFVYPTNSREFVEFLRSREKIDYLLMCQEDYGGIGHSLFVSRKQVLSKTYKTIEFTKYLLDPITTHIFSFAELFVVKKK